MQNCFLYKKPLVIYHNETLPKNIAFTLIILLHYFLSLSLNWKLAFLNLWQLKLKPFYNGIRYGQNHQLQKSSNENSWENIEYSGGTMGINSIRNYFT